MTKVNLTPRLYFSYSQFLVYDQSVAAPGCLWTEKHTAQGFARRESTVCFGTLIEFGHADVTAEFGRFVPNQSHERVIAVPFTVVTGKIIVDGPDENNVQRLVELPNGNYRLVAAQRAIGDETEAVDLFFENLSEPSRRSEIIVADKQLEVPGTLLETADVA
jgi:hypothetical protein